MVKMNMCREKTNIDDVLDNAKYKAKVRQYSEKFKEYWMKSCPAEYFGDNVVKQIFDFWIGNRKRDLDEGIYQERFSQAVWEYYYGQYIDMDIK